MLSHSNLDAIQGERTDHLTLKSRDMAHLVPTKGFSQPNTDMSFSPFRWTYRPRPFLLMQNLL